VDLALLEFFALLAVVLVVRLEEMHKLPVAAVAVVQFLKRALFLALSLSHALLVLVAIQGREIILEVMEVLQLLDHLPNQCISV
jgi:hypothetical protein